MKRCFSRGRAQWWVCLLAALALLSAGCQSAEPRPSGAPAPQDEFPAPAPSSAADNPLPSGPLGDTGLAVQADGSSLAKLAVYITPPADLLDLLSYEGGVRSVNEEDDRWEVVELSSATLSKVGELLGFSPCGELLGPPSRIADLEWGFPSELRVWLRDEAFYSAFYGATFVAEGRPVYLSLSVNLSAAATDAPGAVGMTGASADQLSYFDGGSFTAAVFQGLFFDEAAFGRSGATAMFVRDNVFFYLAVADPEAAAAQAALEQLIGSF
jgi:hypothetical protein